MKTLILTIALLVITSLSFAQENQVADSNNIVFDSESVQCVMFPVSNDMVTMILEKDPGEKVNVRIKSSNSDLLYQKRINKVDKARVKFDISQFPTGEYTFELVQGKEVLYTKIFSKKDETVALAK